MIFRFQIEDMIIKINNAGGKVSHKTHAIYTSEGIEFDEDVYPLEIVVVKEMPKNAVCIIAKKVVK